VASRPGSNKPKDNGKKDIAVAAQAGAKRHGAAALGEKMSGKDCERAMKKLHVQLVKMQEWFKQKGLKVCVIFDKRWARLNIISHLLSNIAYGAPPREKTKLPKRQKAGGYREPNYPCKMVPAKF